MADQFTLLLFFVVFVGFLGFNLFLSGRRTRNSVRGVEVYYGLYKIFSGVFIALGFYALLEGTLVAFDSDSTNPIIRFFGGIAEGVADFQVGYIGIFYIILGMILFTFSTSNLKRSIFRPIQEFSLTSSVFGKKSIMVRFPELGAVELKDFARNFNMNTKELADQISLLEIHKNQIVQTMRDVEMRIGQTDPRIDTFNNVINGFSTVLEEQNRVNGMISDTKNNAETLIQSYEHTTNSLISKLTESVEYLNLLTINIAIEAANTENEAFETISVKSREFFNEFEDFVSQAFEQLITIESSFKKVYRNFSDTLEGEDNALQANRALIEQARGVLRENEFSKSEIDTLKEGILRTVGEFERDFPKSY